MLPQELIRRKRDGRELTAEEIGFIVAGIGNGRLTEGQIAAFAMAVFFRGLSRAELAALTLGMANSGVRLDWKSLDLPGPVVDKHSSGGVGDKVSIMLAPLVAACGACVPMISGRGLGHTGGTLDKMAAIPGYRVQPDLPRFRRAVQTAGCAIVGQTDDLAPADRQLYAIRDVTGTVESIPLLVSSILSKKLAAGLDGLVMDVKMGSGAFAAEPRMAEDLAQALVDVATAAGLPTVALITDMDRVLGSTVGNALEVAESVAYLRNDPGRDPRLHELVVLLAAEMLLLVGIVPDVEAGRARAEAALADGRAAEHFARMIAALDGPKDFLDRSSRYLPRAACVRACRAPRSGVVKRMKARQIGVAVLAMGGGRTRPGDNIDPAVGLTEMVEVGSEVKEGDVLAVVHASSEAALDAADAVLLRAIRIGNDPPPPVPLIHRRVAL